MNKKQIIIRVTRIAPKRYLVEQKRKFLWLCSVGKDLLQIISN